MKNDDAIYEPKGVQFVDIYIILHYTLHYIWSSPTVCVYGCLICLPNETKSRPHCIGSTCQTPDERIHQTKPLLMFLSRTLEALDIPVST